MWFDKTRYFCIFTIPFSKIFTDLVFYMRSQTNERTASSIIAMCKDKYNWKGSLFKTIDQNSDIQSFLIRLYLDECNPQESYKDELRNCEYFIHKVFDDKIICGKIETKRIAHEVVGAWHMVRVPEYVTQNFKSFPILKTRNTKYGIFDEITTHKLFPTLFIIIPTIISIFICHSLFLFCGVFIIFWPVALLVGLLNIKNAFPFLFCLVCGVVYYFGIDGSFFAEGICNPTAAFPFFISALFSLCFVNRFQGVFLGIRQWEANIYRPLEDEFSPY